MGCAHLHGRLIINETHDIWLLPCEPSVTSAFVFSGHSQEAVGVEEGMKVPWTFTQAREAAGPSQALCPSVSGSSWSLGITDQMMGRAAPGQLAPESSPHVISVCVAPVRPHQGKDPTSYSSVQLHDKHMTASVSLCVLFDTSLY